MKSFIENFFEIFEETDISEITPDQKFRDLDEWDAMAVLMLIAMFDEQYDKQITGNNIKEAQTVEDLYNLIK
jgi:acyl carrier protein